MVVQVQLALPLGYLKLDTFAENKVIMNKIKKEIAQNYLSDARDFRARFDHLWEKELHKTGRIKSFTDLLMAFECALKCHAVLSHRSNNPVEVYFKVKQCSHDISTLCSLATFLAAPEIYNTISKELSQFDIQIRYLLNADASFFPLFDGWENAPINYSQTIGNNPWVMELRETLNNLIDPLNEEFGGYVGDTMGEILKHAEEMKMFYGKVLKKS